MHSLKKTSLAFATFIVFWLYLETSMSATTEQDLTLSSSEKVKLDELKTTLSPFLPHEYMKTEQYLIPWLRVNKFDVPTTVQKLNEHLIWREENKMDSVLAEDWSDFDNEYRINLEGCDNEGRPIISIFLGEWNIRKAFISGKGRRMLRYAIKILEEARVVIRNMQLNGDNITRMNIVLDMSSYSIQEQGCSRCNAMFVQFLNVLDKHYPHIANKILVLRTPQVAHSIWESLKHVAPKQIQELIYIYGKNNKDWAKDFKKHGISRHNVSPEFGGTGCEHIDVTEIRKRGRNYKCPKCIT